MQIINTKNAPQAIGPYSQAVMVNGMLFVSGQIPIDPETGNLVDGDITIQTERVMKNIVAILAEVGFGLDNVVRSDVFISDLNHFVEMNKVYEKYFGEHKPARQTVEVKIPKGALVEISVIALRDGYVK